MHFIQSKDLKWTEKNPVRPKPFFKAAVFNVLTHFYRSSTIFQMPVVLQKPFPKQEEDGR